MEWTGHAFRVVEAPPRPTAPRGIKALPGGTPEAGERVDGEHHSDGALVRRFQAGDRRAFDEIVDRYKDRIYQFARWQVGSHLADDVAQDIFVEVCRSAQAFGGRSSFRTWLYAVARNVCRSSRRRRSGLASVPSAEPEVLLEIPDPGTGPLENVERRELHATLRRAVAELPRHHRTALMLRDWEGLSYQQISEVLEIPVGTVRSRLHNARARLAHRLHSDDKI